MNYATIFVGLLALAIIPDDAGWLQFTLQSIFGLTVFIAGSIMLLQENTSEGV